MTRAGLCTLTPSARQQEVDWLYQVAVKRLYSWYFLADNARTPGRCVMQIKNQTG